MSGMKNVKMMSEYRKWLKDSEVLKWHIDYSFLKI